MRAIVLAVVIGFGSVSPLHAQSLVGQVQTVTIARGDTLRALGARFGVDAATIARDNGLSLDVPLQVGAELRIDNRHIVPSFPPDVTVLVNVPQRMVFAVSNNGVAAYPIAVGRASWPTPLGGFTIAVKETNPTWDVPPSIREEARRAGRSLPLKVPPGPNNPLGAYWLGLSVGSVGLHGTNAPSSVYQAVTHGCIRLQASNIEELFGLVQVGTRGELVYQPLLMLARGRRGVSGSASRYLPPWPARPAGVCEGEGGRTWCDGPRGLGCRRQGHSRTGRRRHRHCEAVKA